MLIVQFSHGSGLSVGYFREGEGRTWLVQAVTTLYRPRPHRKAALQVDYEVPHMESCVTYSVLNTCIVAKCWAVQYYTVFTKLACEEMKDYTDLLVF